MLKKKKRQQTNFLSDVMQKKQTWCNYWQKFRYTRDSLEISKYHPNLTKLWYLSFYKEKLGNLFLFVKSKMLLMNLIMWYSFHKEIWSFFQPNIKTLSISSPSQYRLTHFCYFITSLLCLAYRSSTKRLYSISTTTSLTPILSPLQREVYMQYFEL